MCLAIPGRITEFDDEHYALVDVSGVRRRVNVALLADDGLETDDWVLIHVGFAMSKISPEDAEEQMNLLRMLGEAEEAMAEVEGYGTVENPSTAAAEIPAKIPAEESSGAG